MSDGVAKVRRKQLRIALDMRIDVVDDARGGHGARTWKSRNETIASEKVVPMLVRDEIVVSGLRVFAFISPSTSTPFLISSATTRTASRAPKISVDVVGETFDWGYLLL